VIVGVAVGPLGVGVLVGGLAATGEEGAAAIALKAVARIRRTRLAKYAIFDGRVNGDMAFSLLIKWNLKKKQRHSLPQLRF